MGKACCPLVCLTIGPRGNQQPRVIRVGEGRHRGGRNPERVPVPPGESVRTFWRRRQLLDESEPGLIRSQKEWDR